MAPLHTSIFPSNTIKTPTSLNRYARNWSEPMLSFVVICFSLCCVKFCACVTVFILVLIGVFVDTAADAIKTHNPKQTATLHCKRKSDFDVHDRDITNHRHFISISNINTIFHTLRTFLLSSLY